MLEHVEGCSTCRDTVLGLSNDADTLVARLRRASVRDPYVAEPQCQAALNGG